MAAKLPQSIQNLIDQFARLPGIGPKSASRLVFYLLTKPEAYLEQFGQAVLRLRQELTTCTECWNISESQPCAVCADVERSKELLMIVEEPLDVLALERAGWQGRYHVLGGVISPINGIGPEQLRIRELFDRLIADRKISEVVLGTDPSLEGEATALYVQKQLEKLAAEYAHLGTLKITRLARGLPVGSDLEYADELTLSRALEGRKEY